jgi:hypothetical protein
MTLRDILSVSPSAAWKMMRRWWIRRELDHIGFELAFIQHQRKNDFHVERVLQGRQALLRAELLDL